MDEKSKSVLSALQALCARREYCSSEMLKKASDRLEGDVAGAKILLESLESDGFVDNLRYASAFAREKASLTGWGPVKIRFALRAKGIESETISAALAGIDGEKAGDKLARLLAAKRKTLKGDPQIKLKLLKFALGRGYEYDSIVSVLENIDGVEDS